MNRFGSILGASKLARGLFGAALGFASVGCDDALARVDLIANLRVLAARVEVEGEPERASPAPGETASVRWLAVARDPAPLLGWAFSICAAAPPGGTLPSCAAEPFAIATAEVPVAGEPRIDFTVPDDIDTRALAVFGVVCLDSAPTFDGETFDCTGARGRLASLDFELETAESSNRNPIIEPESLTLDGDSIPAGLDCATLPTVARKSSHTLDLWLDESDRDALKQETSADPAKEELQVSHFTTAGTLERAFTIFEAGDNQLRASVKWQAPESLPADGIARIYFVVRDLRGGSDWIERAVCVE